VLERHSLCTAFCFSYLIIFLFFRLGDAHGSRGPCSIRNHSSSPATLIISVISPRISSTITSASYTLSLSPLSSFYSSPLMLCFTALFSKNLIDVHFMCSDRLEYAMAKILFGQGIFLAYFASCSSLVRLSMSHSFASLIIGFILTI
jgi:hypothetical protein